jgi:hypothetical protein
MKLNVERKILKKQVSYNQEIKNMNCAEFKLWTETATETEILSAPEAVLNHSSGCSSCNEKLQVLQESIQFMNSQKQLVLSDLKTRQITDVLSEMLENKKSVKREFSISRLAIAAVIIFGILTGALAGGLIPSKSTSESNTWGSEFTLLSDNTSTDSYVFD